MNLYLLRHGDALPAVGDDATRPLSPLGEEQASLVGNIMQRLGISIDVLLCSPLERAQQTARKIQEILPIKKFILTEHLTPSSNHRNIFNELQSVCAENILCVGHEPHLSTMISLLVSGSRGANITVAKASLAYLEVARPISQGNGVLKWLVTPETIQALSYR